MSCPGDDPYWIEEYGKVALTGESIHFDNYSPALQRHYDVYAFQPAPRQFAVIFTDITERKQAEEALRESRNQFRALIQSLYSGVALIDEHGRFTIVNPRFLQLFGIKGDPDDILNVNSQDWSAWQVFEEDGALLHVDEHPVRKAAMTGQAVRNRLVGVRLPAGGDMVWMLVSAEPIIKSDGRLDLLICTYHDISQRKRAEESVTCCSARKGRAAERDPSPGEEQHAGDFQPGEPAG